MKRLCLWILAAVPFVVQAQQDEQFTQFMHNRIFYNPGVAGTTQNICINALHRSQWVGFEGAPITQNLNANIPLPKLHGGLGVTIISDQIGFYSNVGAQIGYSYNMLIGTGTLGIGVAGSFRNQSTDASGWVPSDINRSFGGIGGGVGAFADPSLTATDASGFMVDLNFGAYYKADRWWAGISSTRLIQSNVEVDGVSFPDTLGGGGGSLGNSSFFSNFRHLYAMGGYSWDIPRSNLTLEPSALVKMSNSAPTFDFNTTLVYNNKFWGGVSYRLEDAIAANIGYQFTQSLRAGYSYDIPTSDLSTQGAGSHEIMVRYCFKIQIPPREPGSYRNPRFL